MPIIHPHTHILTDTYTHKYLCPYVYSNALNGSWNRQKINICQIKDQVKFRH